MSTTNYRLNVALFLLALHSPAILANTAYSIRLSLSNPSPTVGGKDTASVKLTNDGDQPATAQFFIVLPDGFTADNFSPACGGGMTAADKTRIAVTGATVPAHGTCDYSFRLNVPPVAYLHPGKEWKLSIEPANAPGLATLTSASAPTIRRVLGAAPGLYNYTRFPAKVRSVQVLDMFITPEADPGPDSNVFWSNQMNALNGYTGLQSTQLASASEGHGRQFIFALWGATKAEAGTSARSGIGSGSFCTANSTATDGSPGARCRYRYEWQVGHTYRFRVTSDTRRGPGWFVSNVTDVTGGKNGDSFDIGSIYVGGRKTDVPTTGVAQWVEYFDWNSNRTSCPSIAYTRATFSVRAYDAQGHAVELPHPTVSASSICPAVYATIVKSADSTTLIGGPGQSAAGWFKAKDNCLTAQSGLTDIAPPGVNRAMLGNCPDAAAVRFFGGAHFRDKLWVVATDGTIQAKSSYCLTVPAPGDGAHAVIQTCVPGEDDQQWHLIDDTHPGHSQLVSVPAGLCLAPDGAGGLDLQTCSDATRIWAAPGKSFGY